MNNGINRGAGAPPVPPAYGIGQHQNQNAIQAFVARWKSLEGLGGQASVIIATTTLPAMQNVAATVTVFQLVNNVERQIGSTINAHVSAGKLEAKWNVPMNQNAGNYHFKVTAAVAGKNYVGRTNAALVVTTDGFVRR